MSNKRNKYIALLISLIMLFDFVPLSVISEEAVVVDKSESQTVPVLLDPEDGTLDEEEFWEEVISEHIDDYTVTVTVTKEAEFPIGTTVTITPLSSGAYRNEAANLFDRNDNKLGSFIRVFDITFWYDDMEIEPLVPVDVKVTFDNAVELEGNNELKLIHLHEDEEAKEISAETETTQTEDSEAIESLSFQSDKFSTYIVAEEIVVYTFSESGNNYEVVLKVNSAMGIPQDAVFTVDEITKDSDLYDQYAAQVAAVINPDGAVRMPALLDISLKTADGEKIQLDNKVQVIVRLTDEDVKRGLQVVHFPGEDPFQGESAVRDAVANNDNIDEIEVLDIESERLYPRLNTKENTVTFNTDSFSVFALAYTVEFTCEDLNGNLHMDFTGYDVLSAEDESPIVYDTAECDIHVSTEWLSSLLRQAAEPTEGITVETEINGNFRFNFASAEETEAIGGVQYADGGLAITADGSVCLTDGKRNLTVSITNLSALKEEILETEGVSIEILDGNVPLGSEVSYEMHTEEDTQKLVDLIRENEAKDEQPEEQINEQVEETTEDQTKEQPEDDVGYAAADLRIIWNGEDVNAAGLFKVTVDKNSLVPEGMILKQLYHIHDGEVEPLEVEETGTGFVFEVVNFSDIVAFYTVEFHNGDKEVVISGGSKILLSTLLANLELVHRDGTPVIVDDVEKVEFATPALFNILEVFKDNEVALDGNTEPTVIIETEHDFVITSLMPFDEDAMIITLYDGTVIRLRVTDDQQDTLTTSIKFFALDAEIIKKDQDPQNPEMHIIGNQEAPSGLLSTYYVLAILKDSQGHELGWTITPVTLREATTQVYFSEFNAFESQNEGESAEDYAARRGQAISETKLYYDKTQNTIETRLYRADTSLTSVNYHELVTNHAANNTYSTPEEGYEFGGNFTNDDKTQNEIHLKKANNKKYKVRIYLDPDAEDDIATSDKYYMYIEVAHESGDPSYQYVPLEISADTTKGHYIEYSFPHWMDRNGNLKAATAANNTFTGNEQGITVKLLKFSGDFRPNNYENATVNEEGSAIKAYKVHYDTAATNPKDTASGYYEETETVDGKTIVYCIDKVELQTIDAEGKYNYASILGPNLNYGIVADHLFHDNHMQSNFAVNHYTGHGHDARPDLSGSSGGQIVIAEYNEMVSDFWTKSVTNGVGEPATTIPAGQLKIGNPISGTLVVYADNDSGSTQPVDSQNYGKVGGNLAQTVVIQADGKDLSTNIVEPALHYMDYISAELASHPATFVPPVPTSGKLTIDTKSFPDDATIFIDADPITKFIGSTGDLIIEKNPNQTIIFNFKENRSWAAETVKFAQFVVKQDGFPADGYKTESPVGTGTTENKYMDAIARHIVWNLYGIHGKMEISSSSGGIFLQPNVNSWMEINATTAGWIVTEGVVSHPSGEWHNVFAEMPATSSVKLNAYKRIDSKQPRVSQKFNFFLDEYDKTVDGNWKSIYSNINNQSGSIDFPEITDLSVGWHVYRITESQTKPAGTNGFYVMDDDAYYAAVNVQLTTTAGGQAATIVSTPVYYNNFNPSAFNSSSPTLTGFSDQDKVSRVTFENEEVKEGLNILKKVQGTTVSNVEFTFKVELWYEENGTISPIRTQDEINNGQASFNITRSTTGSDVFTIIANEDNHSVGYVTLRAGELVNIPKEVNKAAHYRITETKVNDKTISTETYIDGYKCLTQPQTGDLTTGFAQVVFENEYKATGTLQLAAHKTLTDKTGANKQLAENSFAFRLGGLHADPDQWVWNDNQGNAVLPQITYTMADMKNAVPDPENENKLTKTLTYTVHEKHELGSGATELAAENVTYDDDKLVTVTLVDDGQGHITATPDVSNFTVEFNNTYEYQVSKSFDGIKTLTGRDMQNQEFWFNAVLTKYNDTTYTDDSMRAGVEFVSATEVEGTNTAGGSIVFPVLTFKRAGTYVFTVTEDEARLPEDVEPSTPGQSYDVTIVVTESTASNDEKILVAADPTYTNAKTINNTQKKMSFTVTKDWKNKESEDVNDGHSITFTVYKDGEVYAVTAEHIEKVGTVGSYSVNEGKVTLTADTNGWPTVKIKELMHPVTGYTVVETKPEASSENADVITKYALNTGSDENVCPDVASDLDALIIKNMEQDNSTGLKVTKRWIAADGTDISKEYPQDTIYFALYLSYNNGGNIGQYGDIHPVTRNSQGVWEPYVFDELPSDPWNWGSSTFNGYYIVETDASGNPLLNTSLISYTFDGENVDKEHPLSIESNGTVIITNTVEDQPGSLSVIKKWEGNFTDQEKVAIMQLKRIMKSGGEKATIKIRERYGVNNWLESSQYSDGTQINVGDTVKVSWFDYTFSIDQDAGKGYSALTFANSNDRYLQFTITDSDVFLSVQTGGNVSTYNIQCIKVAPVNSSSEDEVVEDFGDPITLNASNKWYYSWSGLSSGYTYFVEETGIPSNVEVTYKQADTDVDREHRISKGLVVVTNRKTTPQNGSVTVTKVFSGIETAQIPENFQITATWGSPAQTVTLKVNENGYTGTLPTDITVSKKDNGNNSYTWTIDNLPLDTVVTFAESGYDIPGYVVSAEITPTNGQATAAVTPDEVTITNTYTAGVELPATGGPGTALYTCLGLMILLLAGGLLVFNRRRGFGKNRS